MLPITPNPIHCERWGHLINYVFMVELGMPTSVKFSWSFGGGGYQRSVHNCEVLSQDVLCSSECRLIEVVTHSPPTRDGAVARRLDGANQRYGMGSDLHMLWGLSFMSSPAML